MEFGVDGIGEHRAEVGQLARAFTYNERNKTGEENTRHRHTTKQEERQTKEKWQNVWKIVEREGTNRNEACLCGRGIIFLTWELEN